MCLRAVVGRRNAVSHEFGHAGRGLAGEAIALVVAADRIAEDAEPAVGRRRVRLRGR